MSDSDDLVADVVNVLCSSARMTIVEMQASDLASGAVLSAGGNVRAVVDRDDLGGLRVRCEALLSGKRLMQASINFHADDARNNRWLMFARIGAAFRQWSSDAAGLGLAPDDVERIAGVGRALGSPA